MSNDLHVRPERSEQMPGASGASDDSACATYSAGSVFAEVLLEQLPAAGICQLGLHGEVQYWHKSAEVLLGYDAPQMSGRSLATLYPEEDRAQACHQRALFAASAHGADQHRVALLARDGNRHPCLLDIRCIYDQNDDPRAFAVLLRSARVYSLVGRARETDAPNGEYQLHLLNLVERLGEVAWLALDLHGRIVHLNALAAQRFGKTHERVVGRALADFVTTGGPPTLIGLLHRAVRYPEGVEVVGRVHADAEVETKADAADAAPTTMRFWLKPLFGPSDRLAGFSVLILSPQSAAAPEAVEHTATVHIIEQNWMMAAAHDLREPLRKMLAFAQLLQHTEAPRMSDPGRKHLDAMQGAASRMQALVTSLARLARIEGHHLYFEAVALTQVVEDVEADLQLLLEEHGARIEQDGLPMVHGEAAQLREMFQNLVENSIRYRRDGVPPRIRISGNAEDTGPPHFIRYRDNASGINKDQIDHVFAPFRRGQAQPAESGSGIGLALCQRICWRHGGNIRVAETGPEGTAFAIQLGESRQRRRDDHA